MTNPYNERFLKALQHLQEGGRVESLKEFSEALGFHPNYIAGFRSGSRNVQPQHLSNLFIKYRVSLYYLLIGALPIMEPERKEPTEEEKTALEIELAKARQAVSIYEKVLEAKDEEIKYLRELLKLEVKKGTNTGSSG